MSDPRPPRCPRAAHGRTSQRRISDSSKPEVALRTGLPFAAEAARRNLVTSGVRLNEPAGSEFLVGNARLRGIRQCEPCAYLARISHPEVLPELVHRGGLRAQILPKGRIRTGDVVARIRA